MDVIVGVSDDFMKDVTLVHTKPMWLSWNLVWQGCNMTLRGVIVQLELSFASIDDAVLVHVDPCMAACGIYPKH